MSINIRKEVLEIAKKAKSASFDLALVSAQQKSRCLQLMADNLLRDKGKILAANRIDIRSARQDAKGIAFIDRLTLSQERVKKMAHSLKEISRLKDPIGEIIKAWRVPSGLFIKKVRVPIGVIAIIYESRPDVTSDCLGLCLKSSNALILRGGSAALRSNLAIFSSLKKALEVCKINTGAFALIANIEHRSVDELLKLSEYIDLVIPRGGEGLIREVVSKSRIPVIKHYKGICTIFVDKSADLSLACKVCFNAKVQRPGVCNAMETLLVHEKIARQFLPKIFKLFREAGVEIRGTVGVKKIDPGVKIAKSSDFETEFLDLILAVGIVKDAQEAINHINTHGSHHSDSIISQDKRAVDKFLQEVDSACVFANTSTRFSDGYQFGLGAEMGISTDKIHARGPMAVEELTTYKYQIYGSGQIRTS